MSFLGHILSRSFTRQTEARPRVAEPFERSIPHGSPSLQEPSEEENAEPIHISIQSEKTGSHKTRIAAPQHLPENPPSSAPPAKESGNILTHGRTKKRQKEEATDQGHDTKFRAAVVDRNDGHTKPRKQSGVLRVLAEETLTNPALVSTRIESSDTTEPQSTHPPPQTKISRRKKNAEPVNAIESVLGSAQVKSQPEAARPTEPPSVKAEKKRGTGSRMQETPQQSESGSSEQPPSAKSNVPIASDNEAGLNEPAITEAGPALNRSKVTEKEQRIPQQQPSAEEKQPPDIGTVQPVAAAAARSRGSADVLRETRPATEPPVIHVTIGRIEIKASATARQNAEHTQRTEPRLSLAEYMKQLHEGRH